MKCELKRECLIDSRTIAELITDMTENADFQLSGCALCAVMRYVHKRTASVLLQRVVLRYLNAAENAKRAIR